jgi:Homeodomain-like domain
LQNMMRRHQMGLVFEVIKLLLLLVSGYLTYNFLGRFLPNMWFRIAALAMYEVGLLAWHYIHHYKTETARQHMFSANMEKLCLLAVGSAAGFQLLSMISAGFGDHLPAWSHTVVEFVTVAIFMIQIWAFTRWEKLSRYYQAVVHSYNRELASGQAGMISGVLAATDTYKIVESDQNPALPAPASEEDAEASGDTDLAAPNVVQKVINAATAKVAPVRVEDRLLVLELLAKEHPDMSVKDIAAQTGLSPRSVRRWQKEGK